MNSSFISPYNAYALPQRNHYHEYQNLIMVPILQPSYYS